jgi:hypothetical protein
MLEAIEHGVGPAAFAEPLARALLEVGAGERVGWQGIDLARTARCTAVSTDSGKVDMLTTYVASLPGEGRPGKAGWPLYKDLFIFASNDDRPASTPWRA